jgi:RHS repeat-associated protein
MLWKNRLKSASLVEREFYMKVFGMPQRIVFAFAYVILYFGISLQGIGLSSPGSGRVKLAGSGINAGCTGCGDWGQTEPGVSFTVSVGAGLDGKEVGQFYINPTEPTPDLATPAELSFSAITDPTAAVEVVRAANGTLVQVVAPQAFCNISITSQFKYQIQIFFPSAKGAWNGTAYAVNSGTNLISTWSIENPDSSTSVYNRLKISEALNGGATRVWNYTYTAASKQWALGLPDGLGEERVSQAIDALGRRVEKVLLVETNGLIRFEKSSVFTNYSWGEGLVLECFGTNGALKTNLFTYHDSVTYIPSGKNKPTKASVRSDGSWSLTESYDSTGRPLLSYSGTWTNGYIGGQIFTNSSQSVVNVYSYTPVAGYGDDGSYMSESPRCVSEFFKGVAVAKTYFVYTPAETREIRCISATGTASDVGNLVTITKRYTSGTWLGEVQSVENPDGTMTFYTYGLSGGQKTETTSNGEPNAGKTAIQNGTQSVVVTSSVGQPVSRITQAIIGGTVGMVLSSETYTNIDGFGRPRRVTFLDGTYQDSVFGCCNVDTYTDRDGVVEQRTYDSLKRLVATSRLGVVTTNLLDAAGRVVGTWRIGTDSSVQFLSGTAYGPNGNAMFYTNALGGVTSVLETMDGYGRRIVTTTNPDGGTRIESYCISGDIERITGTAVSPVRYEYGTEATSHNGGNPVCKYSKEVKLDASNADTAEWVKNYFDSFGRRFKTVYADGAAEYKYFNVKGQLVRSVDADNVVTLYQYNAEGEVEYSAIDVDQDSVIDFAGLDRVTQTVRDVATINSVNQRRSRVYQLATENSSTPLLLSESRTSMDELQSWSVGFGLTSQSVSTVNSGTGARTRTVTNPDNSTVVSVYSYGRLQSVTRKNSAGTQIGKITYSYDPHGRVSTVTDARNGATSYSYGAGDSVTAVTTPIPGTGAAAQTSSSTFDSSGRAWKTVMADGTSTTNEFLPSGQLKMSYGSRTYPVEYTYDAQGRIKTMKTWQNFANNSGAATTTWNYHSSRGWLLSKDYPNSATGSAGSTGPDYTYTPGGRLKTRAWARNHSGGSRIVTVYKYGFDDSISGNSHGDLTEVGYVDNGVTPTVNYVYDRRGRQVTITQGSMTTTRVYNDSGQLLGESYSGGTLNGLSVNSTYDAYARRNTLNFKNGTSTLGTSTYGYDTASRLASVSDGTYSAEYAYHTDSSLVDTITFKTSGTTKLTTRKIFDRLNRLQSIISTPSAANQALPSFSYQYNDANQRTRTTLGDGSYWIYEYDTLGQVKSGKRYWSDGTPVAGQQFEYGFDDIGNRTNSKRGGDENGSNLRETTYGRNHLNQYDSRTSNGSRYSDITGLATFNQTSPATVMVNGQTAYRRGEFWRSEMGLGGSSALWQSVTINVGSTTNSGNLFVPPTPEQFTYDLDGNLLTDGRWTYTWDAENRLMSMVSLASNPSGSQRKLIFEYDANSRRIGKKVYVWNGTAYPATPNTSLKFVYDAWNLLAELDSGNAVVRSYHWGTDLSGTLQGAGGVGGLLSVKPSYGIAHFAAYDGSGNVAALIDGTTGAVSANYEYGTFGELLRASGAQVAQPFGFSSKYRDSETELIYYGYRYYDSKLGRWLGRDPIGEAGGINEYEFCLNDPVQHFDLLGLSKADFLDKLNKAYLQATVLRSIVRSGYVGYLSLLIRDADRVRYANKVPSNGTAAEYLRGRHTLVSLGALTRNVVVHELTHAHFDLSNAFLDSEEERDEAVAYFYGSLSDMIGDYAGVAQYARRGEVGYTLNAWCKLWKNYGDFPNSWDAVKWHNGKKEAPMNAVYATDALRLGNVRISCREMADEINGIMGYEVVACSESYPNAGCFRCDGFKLNDLFK